MPKALRGKYQFKKIYLNLQKAKTTKNEEGEEIEAEATGPIAIVPDVVADSKLWAMAGVGFGEYETMLLQKSLKDLVVKSTASQAKLWGKIRGTEKDYFIAEGTLEAVEAAERGEEGGEPVEARGTGVNKNVYWACNGPVDEWKLLPDLKPQDLINARSIKFNFTGNLEKKIFTNPFYFKTEKTYLRAQISRITQSTNICPSGLWRENEENKREIEENAPEEGEIVKPSVPDMCDIKRWVHLAP